MAFLLPSWHLLIDQARPGYQNMARDQALLDIAEQENTAVLRLYRWDPHCLSFGRNEPALRRYDRDRIASLGLDCVRRPTGGRAVWHARELTYSVVAPVEWFGSLSAAYRTIHQTLAQAIGVLGGAPTLAPTPHRAQGLDAGACFASPAGGEVMILDRKVIGSAQLRQGRAFLQHGSILLEDDQQIVQGITRGTPPPSLDQPLASILGHPVSFDEMASSIRQAAAAWFTGWKTWPDENLLSETSRKHEEQFRSPGWTWCR
jgi:lipoate-protein ligase A